MRTVASFNRYRVGKLSTPSTTMSQPSMISTMLEASRRVAYLTTLTSGLRSRIASFGGVDLEVTDAPRRVDDLALQVGDVDHVVVDDADRADAGGGEVERGRRAEPACAEQEHLGVEQLLLTVGADLGQQQVAAVALALLGRERARNLDGVAAVLPQRDAAGERLDLLVAQVLASVLAPKAERMPEAQ